MIEYQKFPISNFRTGLNESVEPWLLPRDAYQSMVNAHLYRGVIEKIEGYTLFATMSNRNTIALSPAPNGAIKTFTGTLTKAPINTQFFGWGAIVLGSTSETFSYSSDASATVINLIGSAGGTGTVNLSSLAVSITFNTAPPTSALYDTIFFSWDAAPASPTAIMGIKQYYNSNSAQEVLVFDQKRVGKIVSNVGVIASSQGALQSISEIPHEYYATAVIVGDGVTTVFTGTLVGHPLKPGTVELIEYTTSTGVPTGRVITDNGSGGLIGTGITNASLIDYFTGAFTVTFTVAPVNTVRFDSSTGVFGDLFTGTISNFFSLTNYQYKAFFTNNVDPIFYYDGTEIYYLNTNRTVKAITASVGAPVYDISKCLHVFTLQQRLLLISPTVDSVPQVNLIYWSTAGQPLDFTNNERLPASTSEPIRAIGYINTDLVVRFSNSERIFRYTADAFSPFRWDGTNNIWACDASYSAINYDTWFSTVGRPAIVGSDGVNVKRVDEIIPDFTDPGILAQQTPLPYMSQTSIQQCYGERFDDIKEGWLCYNSQPEAQTTVTASDNILAFNYMDQTYATYDFPFSCLGFGRIVNVPTWGTITTPWGALTDTWGSYQLTSNALIDLAGDQFDKVYALNQGSTRGDEETPILMSVISKNFNPFIEDGQLARFGYVDLLVSAYAESTLRVQFYVNDQLYIDSNDQPAGYYQETMLTFTPTDSMSPSTDQVKVWKRIYSGAVGKSHTIRFYQNEDDFAENLTQPIFIHSMVLYMKPAGMIFN